MAQEEKPRKIEYPSDESSYKILHEIGKGVSAIVYKAVCLPVNSSTVAIKAIDLDQSRVDLENVIQETKTMTLLSHPNILQAHRSFMVDSRLWVVMPFMSAGSLQSIIASSFPYGLSEPCIAIVLRDILNALSYLHGQGHLHRDIKAGNILIDSDGTVKLADFGVSASIYETNSSLPFSSSLMLNEVAGTPFWMAPEVIHSHNGYGFKADIWSFGITALELAHGRPPLSHLPLSKSLIMRITHRFRFFDIDKNRKDKKKFSKSFKNMVASCLITDPSKRPTADKLLRHPFFKSCKNADFLVRNMLQGLPTVEERFKKTKQIPPPPPLTSSVDEDNPEEGTPAVKHRRISGWNFNEEVLEFEPVFPTEKEESSSKTREEESISKRVRFAGEMIIHESSDKDDDNPSPTIPAEHTEVSREAEQSLIKQRSNEESEMEETGSQINTDEPEIGGYDDVGLQNPPALQVGQGMVMGAQLIPNLEVIQRSLSIEQQVVSNLLAQIRGEVVEMNREEQLVLTIQQLIVDLEREKIRSSALEMQLESMRSNAAGVSHTNSGATASNGHGSSSE